MKTLISDGVQVDSVVCDPPYEIGFMGKGWDSTGIAFQKETWELVFQLLKPGGHLLAFSASRTYHRMAVAVEDSGFEIRDQIMWLYGSGFPKSHNIGKTIDRKAGAKQTNIEIDITEPATDEAKEWEGWGTALKPAHEPICMARKPISEKSITDNVLKHGTGGINIDGCRVETEDKTQRVNKGVEWGVRNDKSGNEPKVYGSTKGRYPANLIHDGSDEVVSQFPKTKSSPVGFKNIGWKHSGNTKDKMTPLGYQQEYKDEGSVSRYFYCAKANKKERGDSKHPTVKPVNLMRYLVRLVTPKDGIVLDPFAGTGTTGEACILEDRNYYLIEAEESFI
jgi:site-specific DNA-methyltransferase (adenine-specific)